MIGSPRTISHSAQTATLRQFPVGRKYLDANALHSSIIIAMDQQTDTQTQGSGKPVQNFAFYCEGDIEPRLNKKINALIDSTQDHIVYLDEDFYVEWAYIRFQGKSPEGFDSIANQIGHLETLSITQLSKTQREPFARLLGEAMARILGGGEEKEAEEALDKAHSYLDTRGGENARRWYLEGVLFVSLAALAAAAILFLVRSTTANATWLNSLEIMIGTMMGSVGALLSITSRSEMIHLEAVAGPEIHRFEGAIRVLVGMVGGFVVAVAIKADLLLGVFHSLTHPFLGLIAACIVAGSSERLVPGLIRNMGKSLTMRQKR